MPLTMNHSFGDFPTDGSRCAFRNMIVAEIHPTFIPTFIPRSRRGLVKNPQEYKARHLLTTKNREVLTYNMVLSLGDSRTYIIDMTLYMIYDV